MFKLHAQLEKDLIHIKNLELSQVLLYPDVGNPWIVLVPQIEAIKELHDLPREKQIVLLDEINLMSKVLQQEFKPDKLNIGALGNMVPQLHIHIICRYVGDKAWPGSIWGRPTSSDKIKLSLIKEKINNSILDFLHK